MEGNSPQAHELHKKFEDLNEEISTALRHQQDALNAAGSSTGNDSSAHTKKDVLRLAKRALDWREDVTALAKHIELQLQHSRALRGHDAYGLLSTSAASQRQQEDDESAKVRCLRSDLRLLLDFRVGFFLQQSKSAKEPAVAHALLSAVEVETLRDFLEKSVKREKTSGKDALVVELFEVRRELMSKISEDVLKEKRQLDLDVGCVCLHFADFLSEWCTNRLAILLSIAGAYRALESGAISGVGDSERDVLASYDTQLYISTSTRSLFLVQQLQALQKELRDRFAPKTGKNARSPLHTAAATALSNTVSAPSGISGFDAGEVVPVATDDQLYRHPGNAMPGGGSGSSRAFSTQINSNNTKNTALLDEVQFSMQKLKRELADLKASNSKLLLANSQLEDDVAHLQRKFDEEKRAHLNGKKLHIPKVQKLEETVQTTAKAFDEFKLSVDLITNMYKSLMQTLVSQQEEENDLKKERDRIALLLAAEIKKIAALTKENERKDKLVAIAMGARFEMIQLANRNEQLVKELRDERNAFEVRAKSVEDEVSVLQLQLEGVYARLEKAEEKIVSANYRFTQLQNELTASIEASRTREQELQVKFERDLMALQAKFDKTKHELLDTMSQNLNLDGRLKKAQEKITRMANINGSGAASHG